MKQDFANLVKMDPAKYSLKRLPSGEYQLQGAAGEASTVLCEEAVNGGSPHVVGTFATVDEMITEVPEGACVPGAKTQATGDAANVQVGNSPGTYVITLRSTLGVINYIGQILAFQEIETSRNPNGLERCVTLEYEALNGPTCNGGKLFHLISDIAPAPNSVEYGGKFWSLPVPQPCYAERPCDHTLEAMSMVSLLLNQNKSAKDIPRTQAVETVP